MRKSTLNFYQASRFSMAKTTKIMNNYSVFTFIYFLSLFGGKIQGTFTPYSARRAPKRSESWSHFRFTELRSIFRWFMLPEENTLPLPFWVAIRHPFDRNSRQIGLDNEFKQVNHQNTSIVSDEMEKLWQSTLIWRGQSSSKYGSDKFKHCTVFRLGVGMLDFQVFGDEIKNDINHSPRLQPETNM